MKKGTQGLIFGMILGALAILGLQMFKEGNTDTLKRMRENKRIVTKRIPIAAPQTSIAAQTPTTTSNLPLREGLGVNERLNEIPTKELPKVPFEDSVQVEEDVDENNNPTAQNPMITQPFEFKNSSSGVRF